MYPRRRNSVVFLLLLVVGLCGPPALGQAPSEQADPFSKAPSNLKVLKVAKGEDLRPIMEHFVQSLGVRCTFCHNRQDFTKETPHIATARKMLTMVATINSQLFTWENAPRATCNMCHNGSADPKLNPPAAEGASQSRALAAALPPADVR